MMDILTEALLFTVVPLFLTVFPAAGFNFVNNPSCMQNCSWISHSPDGHPVENGCAFNISREDIAGFPQCPNILADVIDYSNADILGAEFYQIPAEGSFPGSTEQITTMCVNITFTIERGARHVRGVRFTAEPTNYRDVGSILCQIWNFTTPVDRCAFSTGDCSPDVRTERVFYYDCFCGFHPGPGKLNVSVDTLPKTNRQHQSFREFDIPECAAIRNNEYCYLTQKESWTPQHATATQFCNDYSTVNVTFDLLDSSQGVQSYYVFLYPTNQTVCWIRDSYVSSHLVDVSTAVITEQIIEGRNVSFTTVTFSGIEAGYYVAGFRINEEDTTMKRSCSTWLEVKDDPCKSNPCPYNGVCRADCFNFSCNCKPGYQLIRSECQDVWKATKCQHDIYPRLVRLSFRWAAPESYGVTSYTIALTNNVTGRRIETDNTIVDADRNINATFNDLNPDQYYTPAIKISEVDCPDCEYQSFEAFKFSPQGESVMWQPLHTGMSIMVGVALVALTAVVAAVIWRRLRSSKGDVDPLITNDEVPLPESPSRSHHEGPTGVRLVCNKGLQLQRFADCLRQLIKDHVQCPVTVHTIWDASEALGSHWLPEARANQEVICFLWDENLSILAHRSPNGTPGHGTDRTICEVIGHLSNSDLNLSIILVFDAACATALPECPTFNLPSKLLEFLKKLNPVVDVQEVDSTEVRMAYAELEQVARVNSHDRSAAVWETLHQGSENGESEVQSVLTEDVSLEEEDANGQIIQNCMHSELQNGFLAVV